MARCTDCGALLGPDAEWCGQCFAPVSPPSNAPPEASLDHGPAQASAASPNGASAPLQPPPVVQPRTGSTQALTAAAALAAIPPDLQITLASGGSGRLTSLGDRGKTWVTAVIVLMAVGSDALFFPYVGYMLAYGLFVSVPSAFAIWKLWSRRSLKD